jgi:hypothetical protein
VRPEVFGRNRSGSRIGITLLVWFAGLFAAALLAFASSAYAVAPDPPYEFNTTLVNPTGPEVTVFDHSTQACQPDDIPDIAARAIKDSLGRTQLIVSHYNTRREMGTTLDNVAHNCTVVFYSDSDPDPSHYNYQEWIHSIYTPDGQNVFGFVHNEYHGWDFYEECAALIGTPDINKCWYNAITLAKSTNAGDSFTQAAQPNHLIATVPYQFAPLQGPYGIYRPSNIHLREDGYYYMLMIAEPHGAQQQGICAMRTKNIASATSWRAWDGSSYSVRFIDPYVETSENPADHVCKPISSASSGPLRGFEINSLTFNTYYNKWMLVGQTVKDGIPGFYFVTSDDMIHWSEPIKLMEGEIPMVSHVCGDPDPVRDGAVLDPSSPGRNFEEVDQTANLYFTRFNYFYDGSGGCSMTLDRDLIKYPIQFSGSPPTASVTFQDLSGGTPTNIDDAIQLDATGSTDNGSIVQYDWDMDGDGTFEIVDGGPIRITGFATVRSGEAAVRVYDNTGLQDEARIQFNVDARVDFTPSWEAAQTLYSEDTGAAYSDTRGYGWVREDSLGNPTHTPLDLSANATDRDPLHKDPFLPKLDTTIFMQYPTNGSNPRLVKTPGAFEIAVPCGVYAVTASVGDSAYSSLKRKPGDVSTHRINVEGQTLINNFSPTDNTKFSTATRTVNVCDGRLTIDAIGGTNTKLTYVDVQRVTSSINFQPDVAETPSNYAKDTGAPYSDSRGYGWVREDSLGNPTHTPLDLSANTIDRDPYDIDKFSQKQDTTILMQYPAAGSNSRLVKTPGAFEMAVPCDDYAVTVSVGDSAWSSLKKKPGDVSTHRINIEGVNAIAGFTPTDDNKFTTVTKTVNVCDGRLTIDAIGGTNTKLNYVEIARQ